MVNEEKAGLDVGTPGKSDPFDAERLAKAEAKRERIKERNRKWLSKERVKSN